MPPPLTRIEKVFYQNMRRIRHSNLDCAETLRILIDHHEGDIDGDRDDRIFSRSENEYIIRRYQAELNALPRRLRENDLQNITPPQNITPIVLQGRRVTGATPLSSREYSIFDRQMFNISRPAWNMHILRPAGGHL
jgi:phosphoribosylformylglycinamidine (FGAM) synthase-like amidotransferase family enzyme